MIRTILTRVAAAAVALGLSLTAFTGCDAQPQTCCEPPEFAGDSLILIIATHANAPAPGLPQSLQPVVSAAIDHETPIAVIGLDGTPDVALTIRTFDITRANPAATADDIRGYEGRIVESVRGLAADSDGSDLAGALFVARDQAAAFGAKDPLYVIVDSGVSDTGNVVLTDPGMTLADTTALADQIVAEDRLPQLSGQVRLVGFGYVAAPQGDLSPRQRDNITQLWRLALEREGATVSVQPEPRTGEGPDTIFTTKLVEVATEPSIDLTSGQREPLVYGEGSSLAFLSDRSDFVDPDAAAATLDELAAWLRADVSRTTTITGTTARVGTIDEQKELGRARVARVADGLIARGVADEQIERISVGSEWPGYTPDHRADGSLDEAAAALNRTTQIELRAG